MSARFISIGSLHAIFTLFRNAPLPLEACHVELTVGE